MNNKYILGLNIYHADSGACLIKNGSVEFAIEEERINRIKHWAGFPIESIKACLKHSNIDFDEIDYIAVNTNAYSNLLKKIKYCFLNFKNYEIYTKKFFLKLKKKSFKDILINEFNPKKIPKLKFYDHHLCHLASSHFPSNFRESLVISADGFGDFTSTTAAIAKGKSFKFIDKVFFPHSLGIFYQAFTQLIGFKNYGDEYKVMGLSAYGKNKFSDEVSQVIGILKNSFKLNLNYFQHHSSNIDMKWENKSPTFGNLYNENLARLFKYKFNGGQISDIHADLAYSVQDKYEEIIINYIKYFKNLTNINYLSLSGGCAMNSLANGKIIENLKFKNVYIPPSPGDSGGAIGAAILCNNEFNYKPNNQFYNNPYLGGDLDEINLLSIIKNKVEKNLTNENISFELVDSDEVLCLKVSECLANNKVVGWYQNRMEWGPRALGNRSILANPADKKMKDLINLKIKRREKFRPFAPSILEEYVNDWFEENIEVPYMSAVFKIKKDKIDKLPAVVHADNTGRLQTVSKNKNYLFHKLISDFNKITGVPVLLNTSFNENEPIVNTPDQAIDCFLRTKMDILAIGKFILKRDND